MRWRGRRQSSNVNDARGRGGGGFGRGGGFRLPGGLGRGRGGGFRLPGGGGMPGGGARRASGGGLGLIVVLVIGYFLLRSCAGIDLMDMAGGGGGPVVADRTIGFDRAPVPAPQRDAALPRVEPSAGAPAGQGGAGDPSTPEEMREFIGVVLAETEDTWNGIFRAEGREYPEPKLNLFSGSVRSACGLASAATGPFYCPADNEVYLDTSFFRTLERQFGARGDFAKAYVIAHEVGHHVQNVIGVLPKFNRMRAQLSKAEENAMSVRVELQADCFAGIWAHYAAKKGLLEDGDIDEALNAAMQIGDDAIQRRTQGYVVPESFNHGTSDQRRAAFYAGYRTGRLADCDTKVFG